MGQSWFARVGWTVLALLMLTFIALATWEPFFAKESADPRSWDTYKAEIIRDEFGVPHIYGKRDADVAFGVAIAHAEDDFFTLQDTAAMAKGRYGAIAGEEGAKLDFAYHLLDARGTAERHYANLPDDTRALFEAYATGLNQYAREHPEELKLANLFPVSGVDIAAGFALRQPFFFGLGNVIGPLVEGGELRREFGPDIPGFPRNGGQAKPDAQQTGAPEELTQNSLNFPLPWGETGGMSGSNAWAIAPEKSGDGITRLISNAHQPWRGGVAWYELSVESEEGWHFTGANFPGSPFPFIGHNRHLGWTNTVNRPDMVDIYKLEMDEAGEKYEIDGEWLDLEEKTVILPVKMGPITLPVPQTVYRSKHGPVIKNDKGAFAFRYGGIDNLDQLDAYYRINKSKNLDEWQSQVARMDIPSTNFIYADEAGNIAYVYNASIPDRPELDEVQVNWRGILPGNRSDLIWNGAVDYAEIPKLINPASGWLYNANNEPYTAAGEGSDLNPDDFSPVLGVELKQTNRSRRAYKLMSELDVIGRAELDRIKYDTAYEREGYVADLWEAVKAFDPEGDEGLAEARYLLLTWDFNADNDGAADALALLMIRDFMSAEYQNKNEDELPNVAGQLAKHSAHLKRHFGRIDPPMSDLLRLRQGTKSPYAVDLPLDGGSDTLRASTTWRYEEDGRISVVHGDSFIQYVEWEPGQRVRSESISPFGTAVTRPGSPHYTDQAQLFVDHKLKPSYFWRDDVLKAAKRRYVVESY